MKFSWAMAQSSALRRKVSVVACNGKPKSFLTRSGISEISISMAGEVLPLDVYYCVVVERFGGGRMSVWD